MQVIILIGLWLRGTLNICDRNKLLHKHLVSPESSFYKVFFKCGSTQCNDVSVQALETCDSVWLLVVCLFIVGSLIVGFCGFVVG